MYYKIFNYINLFECQCTVDYSLEEITGKPTICHHHGEGVWQCPECGNIYDHSDIVYKVIISYSRDENGEPKIILCSEDIRLHKPVQDKYPDRTNLNAMLEDIYNALDDDEIEYHEGTYETEILWNWYRCSYEYEEYDLEMEIISEKKIGDE